jgi:POT family proton-dependent oligopeptide transporter
MSIATTDAPPGTADRSFLGHPRGLGYLAFTEGWERFSYYGMQTLLVLYMVRQLLLPGHIEHIAGFTVFRTAIEHVYGRTLTTVALASAIFGLYTSLVYLTPIGGGLIADRWLGRTRTVTLGALLMAAGHFLMAFDVSFLLALACLLAGTGCFKGNLASQIGALYAPDDLRRADAYQIYYLFISGSVIVAPLVTGTLGEDYGWHYGFGAAGIGMLIGLIIYRAGRKALPPDAVPKREERAARAPLTNHQWVTILILVLLLPVQALGIVGNQQIFNAYMLWVPAHVDLVFFGHPLLTTWLITIDAAASITFLVASVAFWRFWSRHFREPSEIMKMALGLMLCTLAVLCLVGAAVRSGDGSKASFGWILGFEIFNCMGFSNVLPVGLALYARASPRAVVGTMIGIYFLHLFAANNLVGWLGGLLEQLSGVQFWSLHALLVGIAALLTLFTAVTCRRWLVPHDAAGQGNAAPAEPSH